MSTLVVDQIKGGGGEYSLLASGTISADLDLDFTTFAETGEWDAYKLVLSNLEVSNDAVDVVITIDVNGVEATASYERYHNVAFSTITSNNDCPVIQSTSDTSVTIGTGLANDGNLQNNAVCNFYNADAKTGTKAGDFRFVQEDNAAAEPVGIMFGTWHNSSAGQGLLTGVHVSATAGTVDAGNYRFYGRYRY